MSEILINIFSRIRIKICIKFAQKIIHFFSKTELKGLIKNRQYYLNNIRKSYIQLYTITQNFEPDNSVRKVADCDLDNRGWGEGVEGYFPKIP